MNSKLVMTGAAIVLGLAGITCLFVPEEVLKLYDPAAEHVQALLVQLLGAGFLGFAALDWTCRQYLLGGIYGRPVVMANQTHFVIGSFLIIRAVVRQPDNIVLWCTLGGYALFAIALSVILYGPPPRKDTVATT